MGAELTRTEAFLLKKVVHRESDAFLVLFTRDLGKISAGARGAQRSQKRFGGSLEPMHTLSIEVAKTRGDNYQLRGAEILQPRFTLTQSLPRLEAAGRALGWVRRGAMDRNPEPLAFRIIERLLDQLDNPSAKDHALPVAEAGLALLNTWGWGLSLRDCVRCGRACPDGKTAFVDAARGGLICSACGGARTRVDGESRMRLLAAAQGTHEALTPEDTELALRLVESALSAHADIE